MVRHLAGLDPREAAIDARQTGNRPADLLLQLLAGVALAITWVYIAERHRLSIDATLPPLLAIGYLCAVVAHEAGHAVAAAFLRFRIPGFAVWPIRFYRDARSWRIGWLPRKGAKGFIAIAPIGTEHLRIRQFLVVAAGPLTSVVVAGVCWHALDAPSARPRWVLDLLLIITLWSVVSVAGGLLPVGRDGAVSDGARLWMLLRGGAAWDRVRAQQAIVVAATGGARPREWSSDLVEMAAGPEDSSAEARSGRALRYNWLLDQGRIDDAEQQLVWLLLQPKPEPESRVWRLQAAWFAAFFRDDAITARKWFDSVRNAAPPDCNFLMAEAALAFAEKRWDDMSRAIPDALQACERLSDRGAAAAICDALLLLRSRQAAPIPHSRKPGTP